MASEPMCLAEDSNIKDGARVHLGAIWHICYWTSCPKIAAPCYTQISCPFWQFHFSEGTLKYNIQTWDKCLAEFSCKFSCSLSLFKKPFLILCIEQKYRGTSKYKLKHEKHCQTVQTLFLYCSVKLTVLWSTENIKKLPLAMSKGTRVTFGRMVLRYFITSCITDRIKDNR